MHCVVLLCRENIFGKGYLKERGIFKIHQRLFLLLPTQDDNGHCLLRYCIIWIHLLVTT
jgi:hypothetical protein